MHVFRNESHKILAHIHEMMILNLLYSICTLLFLYCFESHTFLFWICYYSTWDICFTNLFFRAKYKGKHAYISREEGLMKTKVLHAISNVVNLIYYDILLQSWCIFFITLKSLFVYMFIRYCFGRHFVWGARI